MYLVKVKLGDHISYTLADDQNELKRSAAGWFRLINSQLRKLKIETKGRVCNCWHFSELALWQIDTSGLKDTIWGTGHRNLVKKSDLTSWEITNQCMLDYVLFNGFISRDQIIHPDERKLVQPAGSACWVNVAFSFRKMTSPSEF